MTSWKDRTEGGRDSHSSLPSDLQPLGWNSPEEGCQGVPGAALSAAGWSAFRDKGHGSLIRVGHGKEQKLLGLLSPLSFEAQVSWRYICNEGTKASQASLIKSLDYNPSRDQPCQPPLVISPER